jgi:hypothetical protein
MLILTRIHASWRWGQGVWRSSVPPESCIWYHGIQISNNKFRLWCMCGPSLQNTLFIPYTRGLMKLTIISVGKPSWYCSVYYFLSAKKKIYAVIRIEKFDGPLRSISRKMFLIHSQYLTFDPLRCCSIFCETPLLADLLENRLHYMNENLSIIRS